MDFQKIERGLHLREEEKYGRLVDIERQLDTGVMIMHMEKGVGEEKLPTGIGVEVLVLDIPKHEIEKHEVHNKKPDTVIVIGGMGEDIEVMHPFLKELALQGKQVVSISMPGYGDSDNPDKHWRIDEEGSIKKDFGDYAHLIKKIYIQLKEHASQQYARTFSEKPVIIGHSIGGSIVSEFAQQYHDMIDSVILINPAGFEEQFVVPGTYFAPKMNTDFVIAHFKEAFQRLIQKHEDTIPPVVRNMWVKNAISDNQRLIQRFWEGMVMSEGNLQHNIEGICASDVDVAIITSNNDSFFPVKKYQKLIDHISSDEEIEHIGLHIVNGAGHYGILDHSESFVTLMKEQHLI